MKVDFDKTGFQLDQKDQFLISGEFHYFRVPADDWRTRMKLFKEAGGNTLATYVPWLIHEPEEGTILFDDIPERSLTRFLQIAREEGLAVVLRPGPYQYSELINAGLPTWLLEKYPDVLARDIHGEVFSQDSVSYLHPVFLEKSRTYFKAFADVVRPFLGDPVVMLQTDNELSGIQVWRGSEDYHPLTMGFGKEDGRYPVFLKNRYGTIEALNQAYETAYTTFAEVRPVRMTDPETTAAALCMKDYHDFYYETMGEYMAILRGWLVEDGLDLPICHNSANPNMNSDFLESLKAMGDRFILGSDHYYTLDQDWPQNSPTPQYAIRCFYSLEMLRIMGFPPTVFEMPGGSPSDTPPILPEDLLACYQANLAMGLKGVNYYVYTGGPNFPGTGNTAAVYDYNAHVHADGSLNPTYQSLKTFNELCNRNSWIQRGGRRSSVQVGFEFEMTRCWKYEKAGLTLSRPAAWEYTHKGLLYTLFCSKYAPMLTSVTEPIDPSKPLLMMCATVMSETAQKNIIDFIKNGGKALLFGTLPEMDEQYQPCTLLKDFLGAPALRRPRRNIPVLTDLEIGNIYNMPLVQGMDTIPEGAEALCKEEVSGDFIGYYYLDHQVAFVSSAWRMRTFDQARWLEHLIEKAGGVPVLESSNRNLFTSLIEDGEGHELIMVLNLYSSPQTTELTIYNADGSVRETCSLSMKPMETAIIEK